MSTALTHYLELQLASAKNRRNHLRHVFASGRGYVSSQQVICAHKDCENLALAVKRSRR